MRNFFRYIVLSVLLTFLRVIRLFVESDAKFYVCLGMPGVQSFLEKIGKLKAERVYLVAQQKCPAYKDFLKKNKNTPASRKWTDIPTTYKDNYVKLYTIEERCCGGRLPQKGVVIDESSGSSGTPNNWVRGPQERLSVKKIIQLTYALTYREGDFFIINCFALGPWATGMNVSMALVDLAILKSIGPEKEKLENTLKVFGSKYRYLITGYPPFIKNFVDTTTLKLSEYQLHLIVGGEGISEGLREYLLRFFKTIHSSYGASDLEINIGVETPWTINLRKACFKNPELAEKLFGRRDVPMIFQYNPLDYYIEQSSEGELIFTLNRMGNVAPKVRYNIRDLGGALTFREAFKKLNEAGLDPQSLAKQYLHFPLLYVYGRNDLSVAFYGSKVFTSDIDHILNDHPQLCEHFHSFQVKALEESDLNKVLVIRLERAQKSRVPFSDHELRDIFFQGLLKTNQDFREVAKNFNADKVRIEQFEFAQGPFATRDIRVKHKYVD